MLYADSINALYALLLFVHLLKLTFKTYFLEFNQCQAIQIQREREKNRETGPCIRIRDHQSDQCISGSMISAFPFLTAAPHLT